MKKKQFSTILFLFALFLPLSYMLVIATPPAHAAGVTLQADHMDNPLVISGILDGKTTTFSGVIRLTAIGGNVSGLQLLASDLKPPSPNPTPIIDRGNISIPAISLTNEQPEDVRVTVSNVTQPGDYQGTLIFLIPGQKESDALQVPLMLNIGIVPNVLPALGANTTVSIQVVHNQVPWLDDFFVSLFMPDSFKRDDWQIQLDNQTPATVNVTNVTVVMHGVNNNVVLASNEAQVSCPSTHKQITPSTPCPLAANQVTSFDLMIKRNALLPDDYQGTLRFSLVNATTPATVNVDLKVRNGPFLPLFVLIIGVLVGFVYQNTTTTLALKQVHLYPTYNQSKEEAQGIKDKEALYDVQAKLQDALNQINSASSNATEGVVQKELDAIDHRIHIYLKLQEMEDIILLYINDADAQGLVNQIHAARADLVTIDIQGDTTSIVNKTTEIQQKVDEVFTNQASIVKTEPDKQNLADDKTPALASLRGAKAEIDSLLPGILTSLKKIKPESRKQKFPFKRLDGWLQGASFQYNVVQRVLGIVLVIVLILIGLQTLYVNGGTTFGTAGLSDYLGLVLWGIGAKVAQSTLKNLPALQSTLSPKA